MGKKIEIKIYDDAGHNPNIKDGYRAAEGADAGKPTADFPAMTRKKRESISSAKSRSGSAFQTYIIPFTAYK